MICNNYINKQLKNDDIYIPANKLNKIFVNEDCRNANTIIINALAKKDFIIDTTIENDYNIDIIRTPFYGKIRLLDSEDNLAVVKKKLNLEQEINILNYIKSNRNLIWYSFALILVSYIAYNVWCNSGAF